MHSIQYYVLKIEYMCIRIEYSVYKISSMYSKRVVVKNLVLNVLGETLPVKSIKGFDVVVSQNIRKLNFM
jgi:hypothetical protein